MREGEKQIRGRETLGTYHRKSIELGGKSQAIAHASSFHFLIRALSLKRTDDNRNSISSRYDCFFKGTYPVPDDKSRYFLDLNTQDGRNLVYWPV